MRLSLKQIITITLVLIILETALTVLFNRHVEHSAMQNDALETVNKIMDARADLLSTYQRQGPSQAFKDLIHAYNENYAFNVIISPTAPYASSSISNTQLEISYLDLKTYTKDFIKQKSFTLCTNIAPNTWLSISAKMKDIYYYWQTMLWFSFIHLIVIFILWLCFWLYYRYTMPTDVIDMIQGKMQHKKKLDPIMRNFKHKLQTYFAEKNMMITALAHDIKTPLTEAMLRLEFLEGQKTADQIMINLENIKSIVNSSLEYSKDQSKIQRVPVDIISLLDTIAENQTEHQFHIKVKHQSDNYEMAVEIELFKRMLKNIIENAKKYATGCMIRTKFTNHHFVIEIIDNGLGVPEKFIPHLTTPLL